jgi:hypothetical protein
MWEREVKGAEQEILEWAVDSEHGLARMGVCDYVQRATIPSKRVLLY